MVAAGCPSNLTGLVLVELFFHEALPHQDHDDPRRHLTWLLIGNQLMRCSVDSVRPVTSSEQIAFEINNKDDPAQWRSIADILPARDYDYVDLTDQVPGEEECEEPDLPRQPDSSTTIFISFITPGILFKGALIGTGCQAVKHSSKLGKVTKKSKTFDKIGKY